MISYQVEPWSAVWPELEPMWDAHWEEVAGNKAEIKLAVDMDAYAFMESRGMLHVVTVRADGKAVGYHLSFVRPHFHYKYSLTAYTDVYYLDKAYRAGSIGIKLFREVEKTLKARGVERMFTATKISHDKSRIFEHLGWHEVERQWSKYIGNKKDNTDA